MATQEPKKADKEERQEKVLPLVLEIIPGQAGEGLIDIYEPGSYEGKTLQELCDETLNRKTWSIEERQVIEDINRQLEGGRLLFKGQAIQEKGVEGAQLELTQAGEPYLYLPVRAIKPQEGGF
ncbi:MAG: hypothetical protein AB1491_09305 [Thermodesulfobacteriota bacterium]